MIYPVTPNGVEHTYDPCRQLGRVPVIYPVTPNGVEHEHVEAVKTIRAEVIYPVTPNGVEHQASGNATLLMVGDLSGNA